LVGLFVATCCDTLDVDEDASGIEMPNSCWDLLASDESRNSPKSCAATATPALLTSPTATAAAMSFLRIFPPPSSEAARAAFDA
jgi:hypothetical protein